MEIRRKKRFIAGAECPQCHEIDTMMLYLELGVEHVTCVNCGHHQSQASAAVSAVSQGEVIGVFKPD